MLSVPSTVSIFLHTRATDMRKGFDGLSGIVREAFGADPLDGSLYLFVNRRRGRLKILHFDGSGFWLYYKRLEAVAFDASEPAGGVGVCDSSAGRTFSRLCADKRSVGRRRHTGHAAVAQRHPQASR